MSSTNIGLFAKVLSLIDRNICSKIVKNYQSDKHSKGINTWLSATGILSHFGITKSPSKYTLSYISQHRSHKVFSDIYFALLESLKPSMSRSKKYTIALKRNVYLLDSTVIPLSLSLFDWAKFRTTKGAVKLHTVLDYDTGLPCYAVMSDGSKHDVSAAKTIDFPKSSVLVMDRAYVDYTWLYNLDSTGVFFVTRLKDNHQYETLQSYLTNEKHEHVLTDEDIKLTGFFTAKKYPKTLRIVKVYDEKNDQYMILLTNQMSWTADTISQLYRSRWDIEVFFKHLKQLFQIKSFVGTSENAVQIQMWFSLISILLLSFIKSRAKYAWHMSNLIAFLRLNMFVKIDLWKWADYPILNPEKPPNKSGQLSFNFG